MLRDPRFSALIGTFDLRAIIFRNVFYELFAGQQERSAVIAIGTLREIVLLGNKQFSKVRSNSVRTIFAIHDLLMLESGTLCGKLAHEKNARIRNISGIQLPRHKVLLRVNTTYFRVIHKVFLKVTIRTSYRFLCSLVVVFVLCSFGKPE